MSNFAVVEKPKSNTFLLSEIKSLNRFVEDCIGNIYLFSPARQILIRVTDAEQFSATSGEFKLLRLKSVVSTNPLTCGNPHFLIAPTLTYALRISTVNDIEHVTCYSLLDEKVLNFSQPSRPLIEQKFNFEHM